MRSLDRSTPGVVTGVAGVVLSSFAANFALAQDKEALI
jgi:hypothetical protein